MQILSIQNRIYEIRGQKIILDFDLAVLYEVDTKVLNQAVKRNLKRFPNDFRFQITVKEWESCCEQMMASENRSQIVTGSQKHRSKMLMPYAFTEQGISMLSGILNSDIAINVNIAIMRTFILIRQYALTYKELSDRLKEVEDRFPDVYKAINYLMKKDQLEAGHQQRRRIGFKTEEDL